MVVPGKSDSMCLNKIRYVNELRLMGEDKVC